MLEQLIDLSELDPISARDERVNMLAGGCEEFSAEITLIILVEVHEVGEAAGLEDPGWRGGYLLKMELLVDALL